MSYQPPPPPQSSLSRPDDVEVGEQTPLLLQQPHAVTTIHDVTLSEMKAESLKEKAVATTAAIGGVASLMSILLEAATHPTVTVSGVLGILIAPYTAFQQRKLTHLEALEQTNQVLQIEVDQLQRENQSLQTSVNALEESVLNLQVMEETLETLQQHHSGKSLQDLQDQLDQTQAILDSMETNVAAEVLQNLITVMLATDSDGDLILSDEEIETLIDTLEGVHGVEINEDYLKQTIIEHGRSLTAIMEVTRHLLLAQDVSGESIFHFLDG